MRWGWGASRNIPSVLPIRYKISVLRWSPMTPTTGMKRMFAPESVASSRLEPGLFKAERRTEIWEPCGFVARLQPWI